MAVFVTGTTGYIGSYVATGLTDDPNVRVNALVRAKSVEDAQKRLWKSLQLHMNFERFAEVMKRIDIFCGDLTHPNLGLNDADLDRLVSTTNSIIHVAASLNRKSNKQCFNVNLRGTLEILKVARAMKDRGNLTRFSDISTVAVAGQRKDEVVLEDQSVQWDRSDYDPYARTKKFCEHMVHELLPDVECLVFRPSIVLGDSRFPETTQFDMVRAFGLLAQMPIIPLQPHWRVDIVPADYVAGAIVKIHQSEKPKYGTYHLSSGRGAQTYKEIVDALGDQGHGVKNRFVPALGSPFSTVVNALSATPRKWGISPPASLMKVFWPYLVFNTVFDNSRVQEEMGAPPRRFTEYAYELLRFAVDGGFRYDYRPWPKSAKLPKVA